MLTAFGNGFLEPRIDPSEIGRTLSLHFTGAISSSTYSEADYLADVNTTLSWDLTPQWQLPAAGLQITQDLFDAGVARFISSEGLAIQYGTEGAETLDSHTVADAPFLHDAAEIGQVFYLGAGSDTLNIDRGGGAIFKVFGGVGRDKVDMTGLPATDQPGGGADLQVTDVEEVIGSSRDDYIFVQSSSDGILGIEGGGGDDFVTGGSGDEDILGGAGDDNIEGGGGDDYLEGGTGRDTVAGGAGADMLIGDSGDWLRGESSPDLLEAVIGATMEGGAGDDLIDASRIYASGENQPVIDVDFRSGDGHDWVEYGEDHKKLRINADTIHEESIDLRIGGEKVLIGTEGEAGWESNLRNTYRVDVFLEIDGGSIYLGPGVWEEVSSFWNTDHYLVDWNRPDVLLADGLLDWDNWLDDREISDELVDWDQGKLAYAAAASPATSGADSIVGGSGNDNLWGMAGDDVLTGGGGADNFYGGDGEDVAVLANPAADYEFSRGDGGELQARDIATGEVSRFFEIETLRFGSGGDQDVDTLTPGYGTGGMDTLTAASGESVHGLAGDDQVTLSGDGATVDGGSGEDTIILSGSRSDYGFSREPDGSVAIHPLAGGPDTLIRGVEWVTFLDDADNIHSLVGDYGTSGADYVEGTTRADHLYGLAGDDFLHGGPGSDTIDGGSGVDIVLMDGAEDDFDVATVAGVLQVTGPGDTDELHSVEIVQFLDGKALVPGAADGVVGTAGADTLSGTAGADIISPDAGPDTVDGGGGDDVLVLVGAQADYGFSRQADGATVIQHLVSGDTDVIRNMERVWFSGDHAFLSLGGLTPGYGTPSDDWLSGTSDDDVILAFGGDDLMMGGGGNDLLDGGAGLDTAEYQGGAGDYTITGLAGGDLSVAGPEGEDTLSGVEVIVFDGDESALVPGAAGGMQGTSGADTLTGTAAGDVLSPLGGDDVVDGAGGADLIVLSGQASDYVYLWNADGTLDLLYGAGPSTDRIVNIEQIWFETGGAVQRVDQLAGESGTSDDDGELFGGDYAERLLGLAGDDEFYASVGDDTMVGGAGVDAVHYDGAFADYTITSNVDGSLAVSGPEGSDRLESIEVITFDDDETAVLPGAPGGLFGTAGAESLTGGLGSDIFTPLAGDDTVNGGGGVDYLILSGSESDYVFSMIVGGWTKATNTATDEEDLFRDVEYVSFGATKSLFEADALI